jgi:hypothetical protein
MTFNPAASAAENGPPGALEAVNHADQVNQFLSTGNIQYVYLSSRSLIPNGATFSWTDSGSVNSYSQPFSTTSTGMFRVTVPYLVNGNGADLVVSICADDAGQPNTDAPLATTVIPTSWLVNTQVNGTVTSARFANMQYFVESTNGWLIPAASPSINSTAPTVVSAENFAVMLGGVDNDVDTAVSTVATCSFDGTTFGLPVGQPALPQAAVTGGAAVTDTSIVYVGGAPGVTSATAYSAVYAAGWDQNSGISGTWSNQVSLGYTVVAPATATSGETIYVIGGFTSNTSATPVATVSYTTVDNGQISSWSRGPDLPVARGNMWAAAVNGWLIVCGGINGAVTVSGTTYYAKIKSDGSLSGWFTGPTLPVPVYAGNNQALVIGDNVVVVSGIDGSSVQRDTIQILPVQAASGPGDLWRLTHDPNVANTYFAAGVTLDDIGDGALAVTDIVNNAVYVYNMEPISLASIPFPLTGLGSGTTYHVVIRQSTTDAPNVDNLQFGAAVGTTTAAGTLTGDFLYRSVTSTGAWTTDSQGRTINIAVHNNTLANGDLMHTWQDPQTNASVNNVNRAQIVSTFVSDWYGRTLAYCEGVLEPQDPLNLNTLTTNSVTNWTAHGCTLTASTAQTHGGYSYSGLLTPDGVTATTYIESEFIPIDVTRPYTISAWMYAATIILGGLSLSVNWYDSTHTLISTSTQSQTLPSATWTYVTRIWTPPNGAAYVTLVPTLGSTPSASNPLYLSYVTLTKTDPDVLASVAEVNYDADEVWGPTGVTQLN